MTPHIMILDGRVIISDKAGEIAGRHRLQLNHWGFKFVPELKSFEASPQDMNATLEKVLTYFSRYELSCSLAPEVTERREERVRVKGELGVALQRGAAVKDGDVTTHRPDDFIQFLTTNVQRKLKEHQLKAVLHLLAVGNGANFSVPGSGKTTVVLAAFLWLRHLNLVDALFVVGPPSCFGPWRDEYKAVAGREASVALLAGGDIEERRSKYVASKDTVCELYLTSFQTLQRDWERVKRMFEARGLRFFLVVDEAHYIKQLDGAWANAVLNVTQHAARRCVLTGTPFPRTYCDAFNLFDVLWPQCPPLSDVDKIKIEAMAQKQQNVEAVATLSRTIGALFYRVRKTDLGLAPQKFHPPILVRMAKYEKRIYDAVVDRLKALSKEDYFRDIDLVMRIRRGRMMRLRQGVSYAKLLGSAVVDYDENLLAGDMSLADIITRYDELETPAKLETLMRLVGTLRANGEKVLIWSNFVQTLKLICSRLQLAGHGVRLIFGETPVEASSEYDELTREKIIAEFIDPSSGVDVLVANPAACAESISLHKTCSHAIYFDLSYNCAQYLQSLDRIHRVGGSEHKTSHYHFLQYEDTIDDDILSNLRRKSEQMGAIIDQDYPIYSLDMFTVDDELEAYERIFK